MRKIIFTLLLLGSAFSANAQGQYEQYRSVYDMAEENYNIGKIDEAEQILTENLKKFPSNLRQSVYRLLALCSLGNDLEVEAEERTRLLLQENPYYTASANDPQRFIDMVERIKKGLTATITTASSQAESLNEVPVPTTLITAEMIKNCGGRNLQEVLAAYVPGMTIVDCDDDINIAMRGIYSNGQEKILIMLNGHRLNSFATNIAAPDFSMSLDKVRQIEVLRGPASSLYGGVSLTAVVNVITLPGAEVDGVEARVGAGNYGQIMGNMLFGKRYFDLDLLIWGNIYKASGESVYIPREDTGMQMMGGDVTIGGIGPKPSYDVGIQMKYKNLQFFFNSAFSQVTSPFTMSYTFSPYTFDKYRTFNGLHPGFTTLSHHANLSYGQQVGNVYLRGTVTYDNSDLTHYQVISEPEVTALAAVLPVPQSVQQQLSGTQGISRYINGQEHTLGGKLQGDWNYIDNGTHRGLLTFGAEYSYFQLDDVRYTFGYNFTKLTTENDTIPMLGKGHESNLNGFIQLKHHWRSFILNAGVRYDYKRRYDDRELNELSPRVALILLRPKWNLKLSYSKSFVDAPYLYRKSNDMSMLMVGGSLEFVEGLSPERVHSFQLSFAGNKWVKGLDFEVNGFYNRASDLIMTHITEYKNAGNNKACGVELTANYEQPKLTVDFNLTWTHTFEANLMSLNLGDLVDEANNTDIDDNNNTPAIMSNLVLGWQVTPRLKLHTHLLFESRQTSYNTDLYKVVQIYEGFDRMVDCYMEGDYEGALVVEEEIAALAPYVTMRKEIPARAIINLGGEYTIGSVTIGLNIHNLLGTRYSRSGMNTNVLPQQGRWFLVSLGIRI